MLPNIQTSNRDNTQTNTPATRKTKGFGWSRLAVGGAAGSHLSISDIDRGCALTCVKGSTMKATVVDSLNMAQLDILLAVLQREQVHICRV